MYIKYLACGALSFMLLGSAAPLSAAAPEECSKELLLAFFPETFLNETLKKFNVPESEWPAINQELAAKDREVATLVEQKAAAMNPNPFKDPRERMRAIQILKDTLFEVFSSVLNQHGVTDSDQIQQMLDEIQQLRAKRFAECMKS